MRRNFAQVLKEGKIDLKNEYSKFYKIFYGKDSRDDRSIADMVSDNFIYYHFRGIKSVVVLKAPWRILLSISCEKL